MPLGQSKLSQRLGHEASSWISQTEASYGVAHRSLQTAEGEYFPRRSFLDCKKVYKSLHALLKRKPNNYPKLRSRRRFRDRKDSKAHKTPNEMCNPQILLIPTRNARLCNEFIQKESYLLVCLPSRNSHYCLLQASRVLGISTRSL